MKSYQNRNERIKIESLKIVGRGKIQCSNCGCKDIRFLEINHINGGGVKERKGNLQSSYNWRMAIIKGLRKIDDLNVLCRVCNSFYEVKRKFNAEFVIKFLRSGNWDDL